MCDSSPLVLMEWWVIAGVTTPPSLVVSSVKYLTANFSHFLHLLVSVCICSRLFAVRLGGGWVEVRDWPPDSNTYHRIVNRLIKSIFFLHSESYRALGWCVLVRRCWAGNQHHLILYYSGWGRRVDATLPSRSRWVIKMILKVSFLAQVLLCALKDASVTLVRSKSSVSSTTAAVLVGNLTVTALNTNKPLGKLKYLASQIQWLFVALSYFKTKSADFFLLIFFNFSISCETF